jgi:DNA-binding transcriptional LysR family regulator
MAKSTPDWHLFRSFLAVVREGSLSGAARAIGMTQPTVGRQIHALEESLGVTLFTRSLDGLAPTDTALRLVGSAEAMAGAAEAAQRAASGEAADERGSVRITASAVMGGEVLPSILASFHLRHPQIQLELVLTDRNEDLLRGEADVAVRMARPTQEALVAKRIGKIDIGLYAHRRYLKAHPRLSGLQDLSSHSLIGFDRDPLPPRMLAKSGVSLTREQLAFRCDSDHAQLAAMRAGIGIGISQLGIARRDKNLVPVLHGQLLFSLEVWLAMHRDLRNSRRIRLLFDHLSLALSAYCDSSCRDAPGQLRAMEVLTTRSGKKTKVT